MDSDKGSEEKTVGGAIEHVDSFDLPEDPDAHLTDAERAAIVRSTY